MATRTRKIVESTMMPMTSVPVQKSLLERVAPLLAILVVIMAFLLGSMWSQLKGAKTGTAGTGAVAAGKYKNFNEAMKAYAKQIKIDDKKLLSCIASGSKKAGIDADTTEGTGVGVNGTPGFFINGVFLGGAFPLESFKEIIDFQLKGTAPKTVDGYSEVLKQAGTAFNPVPKTVSVGNAPVLGDANAAVTIIEYSDFQCPFCSRVKPTIYHII